MKRATGPGKVEELLAPPGRDDLVQGAVLFNFDDDDDAIKPEHRRWLEANAIPLLRPDNGAKAFLTGTASKIGAADYNRSLSQRREENVKRFLTSNGVSSGRLTATFSGRDRSTSPLEDDEHDRAVTVWLQVCDPRRPRVVPNRPNAKLIKMAG
jgi:outer membrane protein OmpA-like peptidoglycan-associated protein